MAFFPTDFMLQKAPPQSSSLMPDDNHPPATVASMFPVCTTHDFHGVASFLGKRSMSFSGLEMCDQLTGGGGDDDLSDDCSQAGEKKKRLTVEQVKTLERNFEMGDKLEPERKMQLARSLGLQPRQIAIWFQNRRARWKTKQLEKDYDLLKRQYEAAKEDNDALQAKNKKLLSEIMVLKKGREMEAINLNKETEGSCSIKSENSSELNLSIISKAAAVDSPLSPQSMRSTLFPPPLRPPSIVQFFQPSSRSDIQTSEFMVAAPSGIDDNPMHEEQFCNMFGQMDDHSGFWPWADNPPHNFH